MTQINYKKVRIGAILFLIAPIIFLVIEAIVASAWNNPVYSYTYNFISDLGIPVVTEFEGRTVSSPLFSVMNLGFIAYADIFVVAFCMIFHALPIKRRVIAIILAALYGVGWTFVGLFPGYNWPGAFMHGIGAIPILFGGNIALMIYGVSFNKLIQKRWFPIISACLGIVGLIGTFTCIFSSGDYRGFLERIAIYPMFMWEVMAGILLLAGLGKLSKSNMQ